MNNSSVLLFDSSILLYDSIIIFSWEIDKARIGIFYLYIKFFFVQYSFVCDSHEAAN